MKTNIAIKKNQLQQSSAASFGGAPACVNFLSSASKNDVKIYSQYNRL